jgi:sec-independent protein translocase protein TatA
MDAYSMNVMFGIFNLGGGEIVLILALVLILFGAKKLPELAKGLGTGIKEFKKATREVTEEVQSAMDEPPDRALAHLAAGFNTVAVEHEVEQPSSSQSSPTPKS